MPTDANIQHIKIRIYSFSQLITKLVTNFTPGQEGVSNNYANNTMRAVLLPRNPSLIGQSKGLKRHKMAQMQIMFYDLKQEIHRHQNI